MNRETFLNAQHQNVSQVYLGKRRHCRCGCGGTYVATTFMVNPRSETDDQIVARRLKRAQRLVLSGADVDYGDTYVDVETGNNRALTFYFDEVVPENSLL